MNISVMHSSMKFLLVSSLFAEAATLISDLRWLVVLIFVLVIVDFRYGVKESQAKGVEIRYSGARRRTLNKIVDYISILILGGIVGMALCEPWEVCTRIQAAGIATLYCLFCEAQSIIGHILSLRGVDVTKQDIIDFLVSLLKNLIPWVGNAVETTIEHHEEREPEHNQ